MKGLFGTNRYCITNEVFSFYKSTRNYRTSVLMFKVFQFFFSATVFLFLVSITILVAFAYFVNGGEIEQSSFTIDTSAPVKKYEKFVGEKLYVSRFSQDYCLPNERLTLFKYLNNITLSSE